MVSLRQVLDTIKRPRNQTGFGDVLLSYWLCFRHPNLFFGIGNVMREQAVSTSYVTGGLRLIFAIAVIQGVSVAQAKCALVHR